MLTDQMTYFTAFRFISRGLVNRLVWAWFRLGFPESLLMSRKSIYNKIKTYWDQVVEIGSPKKSKKRLASTEEIIDSCLYILSCR